MDAFFRNVFFGTAFAHEAVIDKPEEKVALGVAVPDFLRKVSKERPDRGRGCGTGKDSLRDLQQWIGKLENKY